jgi:hypothetical protein
MTIYFSSLRIWLFDTLDVLDLACVLLGDGHCILYSTLFIISLLTNSILSITLAKFVCLSVALHTSLNLNHCIHQQPHSTTDYIFHIQTAPNSFITLMARSSGDTFLVKIYLVTHLYLFSAKNRFIVGMHCPLCKTCTLVLHEGTWCN